MELIQSISDIKQQQQSLYWEGPFSEYLQLVIANPHLARNAHRRIYDMIVSAGWEETPTGRKYRFFSADLFGIEETLRVLIEEYLKPAALDMDVKNRILLLMGPVGTGKSTIVDLIKRGMEVYSKTDAGALYGIKGCPMHEEPLHLIPDELREELKLWSIYVEGSLCPRCRVMLKEKYGGKVEDVLVERVIISEEDRVGIGTFAPSDPKSQDIAELTGSIDFSTIVEYGSESDPRAYTFDGELNKANRGLMEFQELLKCDEKFLYNLLSLAQEGNFKAGRFALISADELVVGHTNQVEYEEFIHKGRNEALASRLYVVPVPYNLKVSEEERIYNKLLLRSQVSNVHLAPNAMRTAAIFTVLTRLKDSSKQGVSLVKKMHLYDGKLQGGFTQADIDELRRESWGEGMKGIDPRYVLNRICSTLATDDDGCVNSFDILKSLEKGMRSHPRISPGDIERLLRLLLLAGHESRALLMKDVAQACLKCYPKEANEVFSSYMECVSLSVENPAEEAAQITNTDITLMDNIEGYLQISGSGKKVFRQELHHRNNRYSENGRDFNYSVHSGLKEAVEAEVLRRVLKHEISVGVISMEKVHQPSLIQALIDYFGYCRICAYGAVTEISDLLSL